MLNAKAKGRLLVLRVKKLSRPFAPDGGVAFLTVLNGEIGASDLVFLLEDSQAIGKGEALHQNIRDFGGGLVSVSNGTIRFSSSDCTDCNTNGRDYAVAILDDASVQNIAIERVAANLELLLKSIVENNRHNNAFFINFFTYYKAISDCLKRNGLEVPSSILEIGSGARPYTAFRFLLEGAQRFVANDLIEIETSFSREFVSALRAGCEAIDPALCRHADRIFRLNRGVYNVVGLEALSGQSFDEIKIADKVDLIISISALEHVMNPKGVAKKMAKVLRDGGLMFHSIDFRDHRNFQQPFEFLKLTAEAYGPIATENRLRVSDWILLLEQAGFEIIERVDQGLDPASAMGRHTECIYRQYRAGEKLIPTVTENDRKEFAEPFRQRDLADLSTTSTQLLCRKK